MSIFLWTKPFYKWFLVLICFSLMSLVRYLLMFKNHLYFFCELPLYVLCPLFWDCELLLVGTSHIKHICSLSYVAILLFFLCLLTWFRSFLPWRSCLFLVSLTSFLLWSLSYESYLDQKFSPIFSSSGFVFLVVVCLNQSKSKPYLGRRRRRISAAFLDSDGWLGWLLCRLYSRHIRVF